MAIRDWQLCLDTLERESLGLDEYVHSLFLEKEEARMTLHKVSSQQEYGRKLIADAQAKLSKLEAERDNMKAKLESLSTEETRLDYS
jgi:chromosome segregation ATPase